jgi:hypothetical protein
MRGWERRSTVATEEVEGSRQTRGRFAVRKDAVVLAMVFILGLLIGVFVTGGLLGTMLMSRTRYDAALVEEMRALEAEARVLAEMQEQKKQRELAEEQISQFKKQIKELEEKLKKQ